MIKLLKYDLRRNANLLFGVMAVLILAELALIFWTTLALQLRIGLGIFFFGLAGAVLTINNMKVFDYNIHSVSRRLLPVRSLSYVWSSLVYGLLNNLVVLLIGVGFGFYWYSQDNSELWSGSGLSFYFWSMVSAEVIFSVLFAYLMLYMIIALARSITKKGVFWVGLLLYMVIAIAIDWIDRVLFDSNRGQPLFLVNTFRAQDGALPNTSTNSVLLTYGQIAFYLLLCIVFLFVIKWCVEKRIEAK
jgi:hypothetical protein